MKLLSKFSITLNLFLILAIIYFGFNFRNIVKPIFVKYVIEVRHEQKASMFRNCPIVPGAIIFLGNSITEGGNWSELFPDQSILNRGIGGDITEGVLNRLDEVIRHQPSKIFICIGTNDLAMGIDIPTIIKNYRSILEKLKSASPDTEIYVQSVLPIGKHSKFGHKNERIQPLNLEIQKLCNKESVSYLDIHSIMTDDEGYLNPEFTNDELHLLGNAYLIWKEHIKAFVMD